MCHVTLPEILTGGSGDENDNGVHVSVWLAYFVVWSAVFVKVIVVGIVTVTSHYHHCIMGL